MEATYLAVSQRMTRQTYPGGTVELRDALAHDWWDFLARAVPHMLAITVPNTGDAALPLLDTLPVGGLLLTGGDDWSVFPERDATETALWAWARQRGLPVLGVCRGAQVINRLLGGSVSKGFDPAHVGTRHDIHCQPWPGLSAVSSGQREVNSFHRCGLRPADLAPGLRAWAHDIDGTIEAFADDKGQVLGILWHPEREHPAQDADLVLFKSLFGGVGT